MTEDEQRTAETVALLNDMIPTLMEELTQRGFEQSESIQDASIVEVPEDSAIEMVAELIGSLPLAQVIDLTFNAVVQLAMVHVQLNELNTTRGGEL